MLKVQTTVSDFLPKHNFQKAKKTPMVNTGDIGGLQETGTRTCTTFIEDKEKDRRSRRRQGEPSDDDGGLIPGREEGGREVWKKEP